MKNTIILTSLLIGLSASAVAETKAPTSSITLENCAIQEVLPGKHMTGAFVKFINNGEPVDIVSASIPSITPNVEIHSMQMKDNVMTMIPLTNAKLEKGDRYFKKGGDHVMLMQIPDDKLPKIGEKHEMIFKFSDGSSATCQAEVKSVATVIEEAKALGSGDDMMHKQNHHGHKHDHSHKGHKH
ncbi:copper chaperone PCu(A)C [Pelistega sp. MC2]|uniref:copper chaperone PCu(A)C n=1 Tax=Pelistega sp. MC2 TaxID=1720297 RepID=UPI0008D97E95|nr:copper chaperone PCu(A)C [Pelistega sp. MC2]